MKNLQLILLKRILLAFWAVWFGIVFLTNMMDGAKALGLLPSSWTFASGNYSLIAQTTSRYFVPDWLNALLFIGVICWEGVAAILFWLAVRRYQGKEVKSGAALYSAFIAGLTLWAAFIIADELLMAYALEGAHVRLFTAQLVTLLAVELIPENAG